MDNTILCFQISPDQLKTLTTTGRLNLDNKVLLLCEWGGTRLGPGSGPMFSGGDGDKVSCCAECGGINPSDPGRWDGKLTSAVRGRVEWFGGARLPEPDAPLVGG